MFDEQFGNFENFASVTNLKNQLSLVISLIMQNGSANTVYCWNYLHGVVLDREVSFL